MKINFRLLTVSILLLTGCNNKKSNNTSSGVINDSIDKLKIEAEKIQQATDDMQALKDELVKLSPLTAGELKAIFPTALINTPASEVEIGTAMGATSAEAKYIINDSTNIEISIIDCAGSGGAGIYSMQYLGMLNADQEDEEEYTKTIDFNGGKAFENCRKDKNECTLTYFSSGRLLISLEGDNVGINTLKDVAMMLKLK